MSDAVLSKVCTICGVRRDLSEFYAYAAMRDGYRNDCKKCHQNAQRVRYRKNPDPYIRRAQEWKKRNPERYRELEQKRRAKRGPEERRRERDQHLTRQYGLSLEEFEFLVTAQSGRCGICGKEDGDRLHVDHDHSSGTVRGLLCGSCNRAMGLFHEDPGRFEAAGSYLRRPQLPLGSGDKIRRPTRKVRKLHEDLGSDGLS